MAKIDTIVDASGYAKPAIFIDVEGDEWEETIDRSATLVKECELPAEEIVKKIADAGIVGLGGACFPTQVKLCPPPSFKAECVIINAVECEPYLTADHQLMLERSASTHSASGFNLRKAGNILYPRPLLRRHLSCLRRA